MRNSRQFRLRLGGGRPRHAGVPPASARLLLAALAAGASVLSAIPAGATPEGEIPQTRGTAMAVSPPGLFVPAGQVTKVQQIEIENRGTVPLRLTIRTEDFAQRANGSTVPEPQAPYSAVSWVTITPGVLRISPGTKQFTRIRIHVPAGAEPGDHNLEVLFLAPPQRAKGKGNIRITEGIGVPVLITVPGPVVDDVRVTSLKAPGFSSGGFIPITTTVREYGDVHHSFRGSRRLIAMASGARVLFPPFTLLRETTVTRTARWLDPPVVCICHVTTAVVTDGHRSAATVTIVIFPLFKVLIGLAVLVVLVLVFLIWRRHQRRRLAAAYEAGREDSGIAGVMG